MKKIVCPQCGNEFEGRNNQKFCCQKCKDAYNNKLRTHGAPVDTAAANVGNTDLGTPSQPTKVYVDRNWYNQMSAERDYWRKAYEDEQDKNAEFVATHMRAVWGIIAAAEPCIAKLKIQNPGMLAETTSHNLRQAIDKYLAQLEETQLYRDNDNSNNLQQIPEYPYETDEEDEGDWDDSEDEENDWDEYEEE